MFGYLFMKYGLYASVILHFAFDYMFLSFTAGHMALPYMYFFIAPAILSLMAYYSFIIFMFIISIIYIPFYGIKIYDHIEWITINKRIKTLEVKEKGEI